MSLLFFFVNLEFATSFLLGPLSLIFPCVFFLFFLSLEFFKTKLLVMLGDCFLKGLLFFFFFFLLIFFSVYLLKQMGKTIIIKLMFSPSSFVFGISSKTRKEKVKTEKKWREERKKKGEEEKRSQTKQYRNKKIISYNVGSFFSVKMAENEIDLFSSDRITHWPQSRLAFSLAFFFFLSLSLKERGRRKEDEMNLQI